MYKRPYVEKEWEQDIRAVAVKIGRRLAREDETDIDWVEDLIRVLVNRLTEHWY